MLKEILKTKRVEEIIGQAERPEHRLRRALGSLDLIALGIGAIIGAGIFAVTGTAAAGGSEHPGAGPALMVSFIITSIACGFAALSYAELASMIPISGSAYTYAYATLGEVVAWIIGWDLIIEYAIGNVAVAISWSGYFSELMRGLGLELPAWLRTDLRSALAQPDLVASAPRLLNVPIIFNLPAVVIVAAITAILVKGIKESARFNSAMVAIKLAVLFFFIAVGAFYIRPENWHPFAPNGWRGIQSAAALVFFAYIGFDAVSTAAEETRNPGRDLPIGMLGSLLICTVIYIAVAAALTGIVPYQELAGAEPLAIALNNIELNWAAGIVSFGAVVATTAVLLVFQLGQPRIFFAMARDGLLPERFAKVHPRFRTPHVTTILTGVAVAITAAFANIDEMVELTNIGTLFAFVLVCAGVIVLRYKDPERPRPFRCPWVPVVPALGIISCFLLMLGLPARTWLRFGLWLAAGLLIYFLYGYRRSRLRTVRAGELNR